MSARICEKDVETLRLPRNWHWYVRTAVLNVVGIVRIAMLAGREALVNNGDAKDARDPPTGIRRGHASRGNCGSTVLACSVHPQTDDQQIAVSNGNGHPTVVLCVWNKTRDGSPLLFIRRHRSSMATSSRPTTRWCRPKTPNRFPDFVRYAVQQIKPAPPNARKGQDRRHVDQGRNPYRTRQWANLEREFHHASGPNDDANKQCRIVSKYPGHTWNADLTAVPFPASGPTGCP